MSGENKGAQRKLSEIVGREIPYVPCQVHRLNTLLEHSCDANAITGDFFNVLETLYVFFTSSTKRFTFINSELSKSEVALHVRKLSKILWTGGAESIKVLWASLEIVKILNKISTYCQLDSNTKATALGLSKKLLSFDFIVS